MTLYLVASHITSYFFLNSLGGGGGGGGGGGMYETTVRVRPGHRSPAMVSTCKKIIVCV